jgi:hypothetical protein
MLSIKLLKYVSHLSIGGSSGQEQKETTAEGFRNADGQVQLE